MYKYIVSISIYLIIANCASDHGEFQLKVTGTEMCKGPKRKNCSTTTVILEKESLLHYTTIIYEDVKILKGKVTGVMKNKELLRVQFKNVCEHMFFRPLLQMLLNQTDNCGVYKGTYHFSVDVPAITNSFYGGTFIYGDWLFTSVFWNDQCNVHCQHIYMTLTPKKSS